MTDWLEMSVTERDQAMRDIIKQGEDAFLRSGTIKDHSYKSESQQAIWWRRGFMNANLGSKIK